MKPASPNRIALYSHDGMGLGHLRRNALLAAALARRFPQASILLLSGARELRRFPLPENVDSLTLPSFRKVENGRYLPRHLHGEARRLHRLRERVIRAALLAYRPDLFLADKVPEGLGGELLPVLPRLRARGTRMVLGLRDILDAPEQVRDEWASNDTPAIISDFYGEVWIYGDPNLYPLVEACDLPAVVGERSRYTGYLDPRRHARPEGEDATHEDPALATARLHASVLERAAPKEPRSGVGPNLCLVGGGQDGEAVALAFAQARFPHGSPGILVEGPFLPAGVRSRLRRIAGQRSDLTCLAFVPGAVPLLSRAGRVVSMGGYNAVTEIVTTRSRSLVIPRVHPRQEQRIRAECFASRGLLEWTSPEALTPEVLSTWMASTTPERVSWQGLPDFEGLRRVGDLVLDPDHPGLERPAARESATPAPEPHA